MALRPGKILENLKDKAASVVEDKTKLDALLAKAKVKATAQEAMFSDIISDLKVCLRMLQAYAKGGYREIPWTALVAAVAAMLYLVNPFDIIPDFIIGTGLIDDAAVIAFMLSSIRSTVRQFSNWEEANGNAEPADFTEEDDSSVAPHGPFDPDL